MIGSLGELVGGDEPVDGAIEIAAVAHHHAGDVVDHGRREVHTEAVRRLLGAAL